MQEISIVSAVDGENLAQTAVIAASVAANSAPGRKINYHILYNGRESELVSSLDGLAHGPVRMRIHRVTNDLPYEGSQEHVTAASFLRFQIPRVLPHLERVIYLDADVLVLRDLGRLYATELAENVIGAAVDIPLQQMLWGNGGCPGDTDFLNQLETAPGFTKKELEGYVNSGVLLMQLTGLRRLNFETAAVKMLRESGRNLRLGDQDVMNFLLKGRIRHIDPRWNSMVTRINRNTPFRDPSAAAAFKLQQRRPFILHFTDVPKPWSLTGLPRKAALWWLYASRSATSGIFLDAFAQAGIPPPALTGVKRLLQSRQHIWLMLNRPNRPSHGEQ